MTYRLWIPTVLTVTIGAFSCSKEKEAKAPDESMTPAAHESPEGEEVVESSATSPASGASGVPQALAEARCAREQRCNNIGSGKSYPSAAACLETVKAEWQHELSARECPRGVDQEDLNECLEQVKNEDCSSPFESLERLVECNADDLCED